MDRNLALETVRVTEAAALSASRFMGGGDEMAADRAAVQAMAKALGALAIDGRIVVGEDGFGEDAFLQTGSRIGLGDGPKLDVALDPLEGATITAKGGPNALSVVAMAEHGGLLGVPPLYMEKIAIGPGLPEGVVTLDDAPGANLRHLAAAKGVAVSDLLVCILDRPRHDELIAHVREAGARIMLISDGDVSGVLATARPESGVDVYMGVGGAPEGVLAAAALRCMGGQMVCRLMLRSESDRALAVRAGIAEPGRTFLLDDMAKGDVMFAATGVTDGAFLKGIRRFPGGAITHSIVIRSKTGTLRMLETHHNFTRKSGFEHV